MTLQDRWQQDDQGDTALQAVSCSICGVDDAIHVRSLRDLAFHGPGEFSLVQCQQCGLMYLNPRPVPEQMARYYPDDYLPYRTAIEDESWALMRWARRRNVSSLRRFVERFSPRVPGRVLDVGCSTGIFLAEMRDADWEPYGVEPSSTAAAYAQQRFALNVFEGQLSDAPLPEGDLSAITLWDVLEHTYDPLQTLQIAHWLLTENGIVVITIPHYESWDRRLFGKYWIGYDAPRHLGVFTRRVLRHMYRLAGFEILWMRCRFGGYFTSAASLRLWIKQRVQSASLRHWMLRLIDIPGIRFLFVPLDILIERLGIGNKLTVVARKMRRPQGP